MKRAHKSPALVAVVAVAVVVEAAVETGTKP